MPWVNPRERKGRFKGVHNGEEDAEGRQGPTRSQSFLEQVATNHGIDLEEPNQGNSVPSPRQIAEVIHPED